MSLKVTIKGIVHKVKPAQKGKNSETWYQQIVVRKPGRTDEFGDKVSNDDFYPMTKFSKNREDFNTDLIGKKVEVTCYLHGKETADTDNRELAYYLQLNLSELKII
jgi:hypothetical protein